MATGPIVRIKGGLYRPNLNTVAGKSSGGGSSAAGGGGGLTYEGAYINRSGETGASNSTISLKFSGAVPAGDYTTGITIEVTGDNRSNYETLDLTNTSQAVRDTNYVQYTITTSAVVDTFQGLSGTEGHQVRISATEESFCGEITAGAGNSETLNNASTINLLESIFSFWKMEESSGTRYDAVGSADLTDNESVSSAAADDPPYLDNSAVFDRENSQYLSSSSSDLHLGSFDFVYAFWMKPTALAANDGIVSNWTPTPEYSGQQMFYTGAGGATVVWYVYKSTGRNQYDSVTSSVTIEADTWYSVIGQHDNGTDIQIAINNETIVTKAFTTGVWPNGTDFEVGTFGSLYHWSGRVDALGYWKERLFSADERTDWYNDGDGKQYPFLPDYI